MFKVPFLVLLILSTIRPLAADPGPQVLDLNAVLEAVRAHDPVLASARSQARMARASALAAHAWDPPQLGLGILGLEPAAADLPPLQQRQWTLTQSLPFPGRTWARGRAAGLQAEAQEDGADAVALRELAAAQEAYYSLAGATFMLQSLDTVSKVTHEMALLSGRRAGFGQLDRMGQFMDAMLAMEDSGVDGMRPLSEQQSRESEAALRRLMGADPLQPLPPVRVDVEAILGEKAPALAEALRAAEARSPELRAARANLEAARAARFLALSGWLPDVTAQGTLTEDADGRRQEGAMLALSLPWLWFWKQAGEAGAAKSGEEQAAQDLESQALALRERVVDAVGELQSAGEALRTAWTRTYPQAAKGFELARSGFRTTALGSSEILMAVQDYRSTGQAVADLIAQWGKAKAGLDMLIAAPLGAEADPAGGKS
jgi:outer membrane protein TolC